MMEAVSLLGENKGSALMGGRRVLCCYMQYRRGQRIRTAALIPSLADLILYLQINSKINVMS